MVKPGLKPKVVVRGAGPAGVRCARALVASGVRPTVIDEGDCSGGQIYRRQPGNFRRSHTGLYGTEAKKAAAIHAAFDSLQEQLDYLPQSRVWNIGGKQLYLECGGHSLEVPYDALVICSGATDRLLPVKGWQLAGSFSLGGAQVALKSQACAVGKRVVFMGSGALLYLAAAQYVRAGACVEAVLDTASFWRRLAALPKLLSNPSFLWKGLCLTLTLYRWRVPIFYGVCPQEIVGSAETGVEGILFRDWRKRERQLICDAIAMGYHLRPESQLADLAGCEFEFDELTRQWLPKLDGDGRSSVADIYLAGDGARVLGADAAERGGELAALAVLHDLGLPVSTIQRDQLRSVMGRLRRFASGLNQAFPWPYQQAGQLSDDVLVCRCERISAGELRRSVEHFGSTEANRAKAFSRVGMGRCQGRYCGNASAELIAACRGSEIASVGRLRGQAPVKPLSISLEQE